MGQDPRVKTIKINEAWRVRFIEEDIYLHRMGFMPDKLNTVELWASRGLWYVQRWVGSDLNAKTTEEFPDRERAYNHFLDIIRNASPLVNFFQSRREIPWAL